jgi:iron(III) transport system substrate-binding protein
MRNTALYLIRPLACLAIALLTGVAPVRAQSPAEIVTGAKKEAHVMLYAEYPGVSLDYIYLSGNPLMNRIITEQSAGKYIVDTLETDALRLPDLMQKNYLAEYVSSESSHYDAKWKSHPEGYWIQTHVYPTGIMYNTKVVTPGAVPKSYQDLLAPQWNQKLALVTPIDNELMFYHFAGMVRDMGEDKAFAFFKRLAAQQPLIFGPGGVRVSQGVGTGEFPVGFGFVAHVYTIGTETGDMAIAPVGPIYIGSGPGTAVMTHAPHPNAARLLADYINSREVQTMLTSIGYISTHDEAKRPSQMEKLDVRLAPTPQGEEAATLRAKLKEIFGP